MLDPQDSVKKNIPFSDRQLSAEQQQAILEIQCSILEMVVKDHAEQEIFRALCRMAEGLLHNSVASIMIRREFEDKLDVLCAPSVPEEGIQRLNGLTPGPSGGSCGSAVYHNQAQFVVDVEIDPRCADTRELLSDFGLCACWSVPIRGSQGDAIGSFALSSFEVRQPTDFHKQLLSVSAHIVGIMLQRSSQRKQLEFMAYNDPLTKLANRAGLFEKVVAAIASAQAEGNQFGLMFLDLNRFKNINDIFGHSVGDQVLVRIADRLQSGLNNGESLARAGSDEFVVLVENIGAADDLLHRAKAFLKALNTPLNHQGHNFLIDGCIGVALYPKDGTNAETLIQHADTAMYQAKRRGNNTIRLYETELSEKAVRAFAIETALHQAISGNQLELYYQTQVDATTLKIVGVEALIRWKLPEQKIMNPSEFIPIAEQTGLIIPVGEWVLMTALRQAASIIPDRPESFNVAVNLSCVQLRDGDVDRLLSIISESPVPNHCVELEITETVLIQEAESVVEQLKRIRKTGVKLAIDDFGIGYSSLAYLKRFKVNTLKIDRLLVNDINTDPDDLAIVKAVIAMGHSLGLRVVAEGVETQQQVDLLRKIGCDTVQGYLFSRPQPMSQLLDQDLCGQRSVSEI